MAWIAYMKGLQVSETLSPKLCGHLHASSVACLGPGPRPSLLCKFNDCTINVRCTAPDNLTTHNNLSCIRAL